MKCVRGARIGSPIPYAAARIAASAAGGDGHGSSATTGASSAAADSGRELRCQPCRGGRPGPESPGSAPLAPVLGSRSPGFDVFRGGCVTIELHPAMQLAAVDWALPGEVPAIGSTRDEWGVRPRCRGDAEGLSESLDRARAEGLDGAARLLRERLEAGMQALQSPGMGREHASPLTENQTICLGIVSAVATAMMIACAVSPYCWCCGGGSYSYGWRPRRSFASSAKQAACRR
jgi:hypothetical protein